MSRFALCAALLAASGMLLIFSISAIADDSQYLPEAAIKAENAKWAAAYDRHDLAAIATLYTEDGTLLPDGSEPVVGRTAILAYLKNMFAQSEADRLSFGDYEFYGNDRTVTEVSSSEIHDESGQLKWRGKQVLIFMRQQGTWKLHRDIWTGNGPLKPGDQ